MEAQELYRTQFVPVIVGADREGRGLARALFRRYGVTSHLIGERIPLLSRLAPWLICHTLASTSTPEVYLLALRDLADDIAPADRTPLLYLTAGALAALTTEALAELEPHYILCPNSDDSIVQIGGQTP